MKIEQNDIKILVEKNIVTLFRNNKPINQITVADNHGASGVGNIPKEQIGFPNNVNSFSWENVISACNVIFYEMWDKSKGKNLSLSSCRIKHALEKSQMYQKLSDSNYLVNGELILAMMLTGYRTYDYDGINRFFNIAKFETKRIELLSEHNA